MYKYVLFQFTGHLSVLSVLQYIINLQPFELDSMDVVKKSGFVVPTKMSFRNNMSPSANSKTPLDLSMRLTPNLVDVLGPLGLSGPFFQNFLAVCFSLVDPHCKFEAFLSAIMQDVLVLEDKNVLVSIGYYFKFSQGKSSFTHLMAVTPKTGIILIRSSAL